ncbi:MAG: hypothetical protein V2A69_00430, partial [Pseudomonadota bacterium]
LKKIRLTLPHSMERQISVEILPGIAPEDVLLCPPHLLCLFHRFIKCPAAFHEHRKYFYEAAFERDLHGRT